MRRPYSCHMATAVNVVIRLCEQLSKNVNHKLCFDNWFSTLDLLIELKQQGLCVTATFRTNRLAGCPLLCDKDLKKHGRGPCSYRIDVNSGLLLLKWYDNKAVYLASTYASAKTVKHVERWDKSLKKHFPVPLHEVVAEYNGLMGGVDLADMFISLYRTPYTCKRWYLRVLFHCVDICKVNAWVLHRRQCWQ